MNYQLLGTIAATALFLAFIIQNLNIRLAHRFGLLDVPSIRRRHKKATPITGGLGVFITWFLGVGLWGFFHPQWLAENQTGLIVVGGGVIVLSAMGIVDDLRGLSPFWKLTVEFFVAAAVVTFEPQVHQICVIWSEHLGFLVWPIAMVWIVGVTNAINLIDGLDGLAGGMSTLVASSILVLSLWTGAQASFATVIMAMLIPSILGFLRYNWNPAKIFLGDNGSLSIGFLLATSSLMCRPNNKSWILLSSLVIMLGYPILDMGLAVLRRYSKGFPLFKADRNHLHFRILRLGPDVGQTAVLLISIGAYLQIVALSVNMASQPAAVMGVALAGFSISSLLWLVRSIERWRVKRLYSFTLEREMGRVSKRKNAMLRIDLEPLFESALLEEKERYKQLVAAFDLLIRSMVRTQDSILFSNQEIMVIFSDVETADQKQEVIQRFQAKIVQFLELYNLQCSMAGLPLKIEETEMVQFPEKSKPLPRAA